MGMFAKAWQFVERLFGGGGGKRKRKRRKARNSDFEATRQERPRAPRNLKIPLTVGFANLGSTEFDVLRRQDMQAIGPLFENVVAAEPGKVPPAQVLFLYVTLEPDGTLRGPNRRGVRDVVQSSRARIVVVANDNGMAAVQAAIKQPGPRTANIVFAVNRRGERLVRLLRQLFGEMRDGADMLSAWAKLAPPQGVAASTPDMPGTLLAADAGKVEFPAPANA